MGLKGRIGSIGPISTLMAIFIRLIAWLPLAIEALSVPYVLSVLFFSSFLPDASYRLPDASYRAVPLKSSMRVARPTNFKPTIPTPFQVKRSSHWPQLG